MPLIVTDEETPLLRDRSQNTEQTVQKKLKTPLPWGQFSILLLIQVAEPITSQVIAPFLPQLIRDIGITDGQDSRIGYYVGLMHSLFFLTEACTIFQWSRMSDEIGRKPVLLIGLFGLSASMWCFGLSKTFWNLIFSRCLNGALNGNIGVMKSMVAEMTDETNVAQAWGFLPFVWSFGTTMGPLIGGTLALPAERYPDIFGDSEFYKEYPYFLPCSVSATVTALSWLIVLVFMKETAKPQMTAMQYLFGRPTVNLPRTDSGILVDSSSSVSEVTNKQLPLRSLLIRPVLIAAGSYAMFAFIEIAFRAVVPVFYAMPIEMGGLNLEPPTIGVILAILGISGGVIQLIFFPPMYAWLGAKNTFLVAVSSCLPMTALFPVINTMTRAYGVNNLVWFLVGLQLVFFVFASFTFAVTFMYISAAAPNKASIGATNGIAQTMVSVMRAVGPAVINSAFSFSIQEHIMGGYFVYLVMAMMVCLTLWMGYFLPRNLQRASEDIQ